MADGIGIIGVGHDLPATIEDNETLCRKLDVTPEWIIENTGIERRHIAERSESASDMATRAAQRAVHRTAAFSRPHFSPTAPTTTRCACAAVAPAFVVRPAPTRRRLSWK